MYDQLLHIRDYYKADRRTNSVYAKTIKYCRFSQIRWFYEGESSRRSHELQCDKVTRTALREEEDEDGESEDEAVPRPPVATQLRAVVLVNRIVDGCSELRGSAVPGTLRRIPSPRCRWKAADHFT